MSSRQQQFQEGGFVRTEKRGGSRGFHRRASQTALPKKEKSYDEIVAEREAARRRWAGIPPLVAAREMIAEADISENATAVLSEAVVKLNETGELEPMLRSGKLADVLAELAAGGAAQTF